MKFGVLHRSTQVFSESRTSNKQLRKSHGRKAIERACRPLLETLETRRLLASSITVIVGAAGDGSLDSFLSATDGTITTTDGGATPGTISTGALTAVNSTTDISIAAGTSIAFNDLGGTLTLQTGASNIARFTAESAGNAITFASAANTLKTSGGAIDLAADDMTLAKLNAGSNTVTLEAFEPGQAVDLGTNTAGKLGLTDAELDGITAGTLHIGSGSTGNIFVSAAISPANSSTLSLETGGGITQDDVGITVTNLALRAVTDIDLQGNENEVGTVAADVTGSDRNFSFRDDDLTVGSAGSLDGVLTNGGYIQFDLDTSADLTISDTPAALDVNSQGGNIDFGPSLIHFVNKAGAAVSSGGGLISVEADNQDLQTGSSLDAGTGKASLEPAFGRPIHLGGADAVDVLGLTNAEINTVTASSIQIGITGPSATDAITISAAIAPTGTTVLDLEGGGSISESLGASITVTYLILRANGPITVNQPTNNVSSLAGKVTTSGETFSFTNSSSLSIDTVDLQQGIQSFGGDVTLTSEGTLTVNQPIDTSASGNGGVLTTHGKVVNNSTVVLGGGNVTLTGAGRTLIWNGGISGNWSDGLVGTDTNWTDQASGDSVLPQDGDNLVFPTTGSNHTTVNDIAGLHLNSITINGTDYNISGDGVSLAYELSDTSTSGANTVGLDSIALTADDLFNADSSTLGVNSPISGAFGIIKTGSGMIRFGGASGNSYTGDTDVTDGTLQLDKTSATAIKGNLVVGDDNGSTLSALAEVMSSGNFDDTLQLTVNSDGKFLMDSSVGDTPVVSLTLHGGTVDTGNGSLLLFGDVDVLSADHITSIGGKIDLEGATRTVSVGIGPTIFSDSLEIDALVSNGGLDFVGKGYVDLTANNTYTGPTTIDGATVFVNGSQDGSAVTIKNGGSLEGAGIVGAITTQDAGSNVFPGNPYFIFFVPSTIAAHGDVTFNADGHLGIVLDGFPVGQSAQLDVTGTVTLNNTGLDLFTEGTTSPGEVVTIINNDGSDPVSGTFGGFPEGALVPAGSNMYRISYVGGDGNDVTVTEVPQTFTWDGKPDSGGGISINNDWSLGVNWVGDVAPTAGSDLIFPAGTSITSNNDFTAGTTFNSLTIHGIGTITGNGIDLSHGLSSDSVGNVIVNLHVTLLNPQTFTIGADPSVTLQGDIDLNGNLLTIDDNGYLDISGNISGAGGITKDESGTTVFDGDNSYTGVTTINGGDIDALSNPALGASGTGNGTVVNSGASLAMEGSLTIGEDLTLNGTGTSANFGALHSFSDSNSEMTGAITLGSDSSIAQVDSPGAKLVLSGVISDGGNAYGLTLVGDGTVQFAGTGSNTYTGLTKINDGTLELNKSVDVTAIPGNVTVGDNTGAAESAVLTLLVNGQINDSAAVIVNSDGSFDLTNLSDKVGTLTVNGGIVKIGTTGSLDVASVDMTGGKISATPGKLFLRGNVTIHASTGGSTITGIIDLGDANRIFAVEDGAAAIDLDADALLRSGTAGVGSTKNGAGTMRIGMTATYSGTTTVNAGTLQADSAIFGTVNVSSGATLKGKANVGNIFASGNVAPGDSPGFLGANGTTFDSTASLSVELNGTTAGSEYDQLQEFADVSITGTALNVSLGFTPSTGDTFKIIDNQTTDAIGGQFTGKAEGATFAVGARTFKITYKGGDGNDVVLTDVTTIGVSTTYLSNLTPTGTPINGWGKFENDKSNGEKGDHDGHTIKLNGITYAKGLGVHANSDLRYSLSGQYARFAADVGIDDEVGSNGNVIFQVWADGVKLFDSGSMTGSSATKHVDVDVTGRSELKLLVLSNGSNNFDHADWADAKLLKTPAPPPPVSSVFLSTLTPTHSANGSGHFETDQSNGGSSSNDGSTLKLNGQTYARGLGVHASSDLRYALTDQTRFTADVGIDDEVGSGGNVIFQVWTDGVKLFDSGAMTGSSATKHVDVDLTGRHELKLLVLSNGSTSSDHADWADAKLFSVAVPPPAPPPASVALSSLTPTLAVNGWGNYEVNQSNGEKPSNDGHTLTLNTKTYGSGLGVNANSDLRYALSGQTRFTADVGIDDEVGSKGNVIFQVWADGIKLFDSGAMTGSSATQHVDVDLTGRLELKLLVLSNGSTNFDHADWADAKLFS